MSENSLIKAREAANAGRAVLKEYDPDIFKCVTPSQVGTLRMSSQSNCTLGILFGNYLVGINRLESKLRHPINPTRCGFNIGFQDDIIIGYDDLLTAWQEIFAEEIQP